MPNLKHPVPTWLVQFVWFLAGVFATGAVWFFLSRDEYIAAWLSVAATVALTVVAIQLHRINDRNARFRKRREALAAIAAEAASLSARASEEPLPIEAHNDWVARTDAFLRADLDSSYAARFNDFSGMTFYGNGSQRSNYKNSLNGRIQRLHEFMREFAD